MITGVGAVLAGFFSIRAVRNQQRSTELQEDKRRKSKFAATRLRLPFVLSEIIGYSNESLNLLKAYLDAIDSDKSLLSNLSHQPRPMLPESAILTFADIIENSDDEKFSNYISSLVREMQIMNSRLNQLGSSESIIIRPNIESYAIQAAMIHAYASGMFEYSRGRDSNPPQILDWDLVTSALNLNDMPHYDYDTLHAFLNRMRAREEGVLSEA